jgi:hypothetical protein
VGRTPQDNEREWLTASLNVTDADGAQTDTAIITVAAGLKIIADQVAVTADSANNGATQCRIGFGTTNTPALDAAGVILEHSGIAAGSGVVAAGGEGADNEDLRVTCEDPTGGALGIVVKYKILSS